MILKPHKSWSRGGGRTTVPTRCGLESGAGEIDIVRELSATTPFCCQVSREAWGDGGRKRGAKKREGSAYSQRASAQQETRAAGYWVVSLLTPALPSGIAVICFTDEDTGAQRGKTLPRGPSKAEANPAVPVLRRALSWAGHTEGALLGSGPAPSALSARAGRRGSPRLCRQPRPGWRQTGLLQASSDTCRDGSSLLPEHPSDRRPPCRPHRCWCGAQRVLTLLSTRGHGTSESQHPMLICLLFCKPGSPGAFGHSRLQPIGPFPPTPVCPRPAGSSVPQASSGSDPQDPHGCRLCSSDGAACLIHAARGQLTMGAAPPMAGLMPLGLSQLARPQNVGRKEAGKQTPTWRHSTTQGARSVHACVRGYVRMHVCSCLRVCMDHIHTHMDAFGPYLLSVF